MKRKISRITLLIPTIAILIFIGGTVALNVTTFQSSDANSNNLEEGNQIPVDYRITGILVVEGCNCAGTEYSDDVPPEVDVRSPPNNSLILVDTIIYIEASDNFPAGMVGGVSFVPEYIYYHWNNATSNVTLYDASIDEEPDDYGLKFEITLPNDDAGATHVLKIFAVDYESNWTPLVFVFKTAGVGEETSVTWTTTTTTTTTIPRRSDGFLLVPMVIVLVGLVNVISWKRRRKE